MAKKSINIRSVITGDVISVKAVFGLFWSKKMVLIISLIIFGLLGYMVAATTPKEYLSNCVLLSEQGGGANNSSLQNLATLLGGASSDGNAAAAGASGDLYPLILSNRPFLIELGNEPIYLKDKNITVTLKEYFKKEPETDILTSFKKRVSESPTNVKGWFFSSPSPHTSTLVGKGMNMSDSARLRNADSMRKVSFTDKVSVSELEGEDSKIATILAARINFQQKGKLITLSVKMPEALICAEATKLVLNQLIKYVVRYQTAKQLETVNFLEARSAEAYINYKTSQQKLASFKDNNYGVIYQSIQATEQQLQNEFTLAFGIYNGLVGQLEQAKIQLKKDTPLFTVLEPIYVPAVPSQVDKNKIITGYLTTGFILGFAIILVQLAIVYYRQDKAFTKRVISTTTEVIEEQI